MNKTLEQFVKEHFKEPIPAGKGFNVICPAHEDNTQSLSVSQDVDHYLLYCHAGCSYEEVLSAVGLQKSDLFLNGKTKQAQLDRPKKERLTVDTMAKSKQLPVSFLQDLGIKNQGNGIMIPYTLVDGTPAARHRLRTSDGFTWSKGDDTPVPYGLDRLPDMTAQHDYLIIVEGESDCWTLWFHGWPALGIPGANMTGKLEAEHVKDSDRVYTWQENDRAGEIFVKGMSARLKELKFTGDVFIIHGQDGEKDPSDLLIKYGNAFDPQLEEVIKRAEPATQVTAQLSERLTMTDTGNGQRLARHYGEKVKHIPELDKIAAWDDRRWQSNSLAMLKLREYSKELNRIVINETAGITNKQVLKEAYRWADRCLENHIQKNAIYSFKSIPQVVTELEKFDADPFMLNVFNGTVNLKTGELLRHDPTLFITKLAGCNYNPKAKSPLLDAFLKKICPNRETRRYLQKVAGYCLTGHIIEQKMFFPFGVSATGKSTFLNLLAVILGDYAIPINSQLLLDNTRNQQSAHAPSPEIAKLLKIRLAYSSEIPAYCRFNEALVNNITGNEPITAAAKYKDPFTFTPEFKIILAGNNKPEISGPKAAIWRRLKPIPFDQAIPEKEQDPDLLQKLKMECNIEAFLAWAVEGCLLWQKEGLKDCESVRLLTEEYRNESDRLKDWKDERCLFSVLVSQPAADLYCDYKEWAHKNGHKPVSNTKFGRFLSEDDRLEKSRPDGRAFIYFGIGLRTE